MHKINTKTLLDNLWQLTDRGYPLKKPVHFYLNELIVLSSLNEDKPTYLSDVNFGSFTLAELEEYFKIASDFYENKCYEAEQLSNDLLKIKALQASIISFF